MTMNKAKFWDSMPKPKNRIFTIQYEATDANAIKHVLQRIVDDLSSGVQNGEGSGKCVKYTFNQEFVPNLNFTIQSIEGVECKVFKSIM